MQKLLAFILTNSLLILTLALLQTSVALGKINPDFQWITLKTRHFHVITPKHMIETGLHYAQKTEQAYTRVSSLFSELPKKTVLVLDDSSDITNGFARSTPYPLIHIFPVLPKPLSSIGFYSQWTLELLIHEFTHLATFEPAHGIMKPARWALGSIVTPNILLPSWWIEGIAVSTESQLSQAGRIRSPYTQATLRALIEDQLLKENTLDIINERFTSTWPGGQRSYLLGGLLMNSIANKSRSIEEPAHYSLNTLTQKHSAQIPYYFINSPALNSLGTDYVTLLNDVYESIEKKQSQQKNIVFPNRNTPFLRKQNEYDQITISPDGLKMIFIAKDFLGNSRIQATQRADTETPFTSKSLKTLFTGTEVSQLVWHTDSQNIFFNQATKQKNYNLFSDIYKIDILTKKTTRITHGKRVREFAISPDGLSIAYTGNNANKTLLNLMKINTQKSAPLLMPATGILLSSPLFINNNDLLILEKSSGKGTQLKKITFTEKNDNSLKIKYLISPFINLTKIHSFEKTAQGFIACSSQSGLLNLYHVSPNLKKVYPLTNESTGALNGAIDPLSGTLYFSRFTGKGIHLYRKNKAQQKLTPSRLPFTESLIPELKVKNTRLHSDSPTVVLSQEDYSPWGYLFPRYWLPSIYPSEQGVLVQAITGSKDPLNKHSYSLQGGWNSYLNKTNLDFGYTNNFYHPSFQLNYRQSFDRLIGSQETYQSQTGSLLVQQPLFRKKHQISWGWAFHNRIDSLFSKKRSGPSLSYFYNNSSFSLERSTPISGQTIGISYIDYLSEYSDINYKRYLFSANQYFQNVSFNFRGLHLSDSVSPIYGATTANSPYQISLLNKNFLMRGYPSNEFIFRSGINLTLEYSLPLQNIYKGFGGTFPLFFKRTYANVFMDSLIMDGLFYSKNQGRYLTASKSQWFHGSGVEINVDTTIGYHLPFTVFLGLYYGLTDKAHGGFKTFLGFKL